MNNLNNNTLEIVSLNHWYGQGAMRRHVLHSVSMQISPGEVVLLTGPSGCGKTTLLTLIGALRKCKMVTLRYLVNNFTVQIGKQGKILEKILE